MNENKKNEIDLSDDELKEMAALDGLDVEKAKEEEKASQGENVEENKEPEIASGEVETMPSSEPKPLEKDMTEKSVFEEIEKERKYFYKFYKKQKNINLVMLVIALAALVVAIIFASKNRTIVNIVLICVVVFFVGSYIYSRTLRKKLDSLIALYIDKYMHLIDSYTYNSKGFEDVKDDTQAKYQDEEVKQIRVISNISHVGSRDVVYGKVKDIEFKIADTVIKTSDEKSKDKNKKDAVAFIGKLLLSSYKVIDEGRVVIYYKAPNSVGPTDISGLNVMTVKDLKEDYVVYADSEKSLKAINSNVVKALNVIEPNKFLIDCFISLNENGIGIGLSYTDDLMVIPLLKPFVIDAAKQYHDDLEKVINLLTTLQKKHNK